MNPVTSFILFTLLVACASAFSPSFVGSRPDTALAFFGKKKPAADAGKDKNFDVFGGKGKRITVREDEDNAMWIEEDDKGKRKPAQGK